MNYNLVKAFSAVVICLALILFVPAGLLAQQQTSQRFTANAMQFGTLTVSNGAATVVLSNEVKGALHRQGGQAEYYVTFTPLKKFVPLAIGEKGAESFTVKAESGNDNIQVDYVVFVRQPVIRPVPQAHPTPGSK